MTARLRDRAELTGPESRFVVSGRAVMESPPALVLRYLLSSAWGLVEDDLLYLTGHVSPCHDLGW